MSAFCRPPASQMRGGRRYGMGWISTRKNSLILIWHIDTQNCKSRNAKSVQGRIEKKNGFGSCTLQYAMCNKSVPQGMKCFRSVLKAPLKRNRGVFYKVAGRRKNTGHGHNGGFPFCLLTSGFSTVDNVLQRCEIWYLRSGHTTQHGMIWYGMACRWIVGCHERVACWEGGTDITE